MMSGSIVRVWGALESVLVRSESILSKSDRTMRIVRVNTGEAMSLIGAWPCLPPHEHCVIDQPAPSAACLQALPPLHEKVMRDAAHHAV